MVLSCWGYGLSVFMCSLVVFDYLCVWRLLAFLAFCCWLSVFLFVCLLFVCLLFVRLLFACLLFVCLSSALDGWIVYSFVCVVVVI